MRTKHAPQGAATAGGAPRLDVAGCAGAVAYEHTDIAPDLTVAAWRAQHRRARRRPRVAARPRESRALTARPKPAPRRTRHRTGVLVSPAHTPPTRPVALARERTGRARPRR